MHLTCPVPACLPACALAALPSCHQVEAARQGLPRAGPASRALTDLSDPRVQWSAVAAAMGVPAAVADSAEAFAAALSQALSVEGPFLIHAVLL